MTLAVLTAIAALCGGSYECVKSTRQCFDSYYAIVLSELNICQKASFWNDCSGIKFDKQEEVFRCWKMEIDSKEKLSQ